MGSQMYQHVDRRTAKQMRRLICITNTRLYNFDPFKPLFYTVKLGFTGVYIFFVFRIKKVVPVKEIYFPG